MFDTLLEWLQGGADAPLSMEDKAAYIAAMEEKEREFHGWVREHIICLLLFIALYLFSYWLISRYKERTDSDSLYSGEEDYIVYRISVWMCTTSLAGSIGCIMLLPFSVLGAELLQRYPSSYYLQWLSWSLLHSLWNYVFFLCNISLFVLLPFAYFFIESQGFNKKRTGVLQRAYETGAVCAILVVLLLCLSDLVFTLILPTGAGGGGGFAFGLSSLSVPLLYSIVSLGGVVLLLVSTPLGFTKMFGIVSELAQARPPPADDVSVERLELCCRSTPQRPPAATAAREGEYGLRSRAAGVGGVRHGLANGYGRGCTPTLDASLLLSPQPTVGGEGGMQGKRRTRLDSGMEEDEGVEGDKRTAVERAAAGDSADTVRIHAAHTTPSLAELMGMRGMKIDASAAAASTASSSSAYSSASSSPSGSPPRQAVSKDASPPASLFSSSFAVPPPLPSTPTTPPRLSSSRSSVPLRQQSLRWYQHVLHSLKYTLAIIGMLVLTAVTVLLVLINALKLLMGYRALPEYAQYIEVNSRHTFGMVGVALECVIIAYIMLTSVIGVYSMPFLKAIRPKRGGTTMTAVIINCSVVVVLTSALPVLASTLGITSFDLLGLYTSLRWLSNFRLVLTYNLLFAVVTTVVMVNKATSPVRAHLGRSMRELKLWRGGGPPPGSSGSLNDKGDAVSPPASPSPMTTMTSSRLAMAGDVEHEKHE
ncbi:hypothetical protein PRIPAC_93457 [Pristionchus pacificus]|uniref:Uncharacterized protein n=1 Tax=Pristionchus pacificus TaxID=54126 RepID=A0A8R1V4K3_PRIPA|nr:hypothetical protein PRIPAC_93457 [Pristionchus pacificus]